MDGNRRFAQKNSMDRAEGHLKGFDKLAEVRLQYPKNSKNCDSNNYYIYPNKNRTIWLYSAVFNLKDAKES